jgi:hypothetical protein
LLNLQIMIGNTPSARLGRRRLPRDSPLDPKDHCWRTPRSGLVLDNEVTKLTACAGLAKLAYQEKECRD